MCCLIKCTGFELNKSGSCKHLPVPFLRISVPNSGFSLYVLDLSAPTALRTSFLCRLWRGSHGCTSTPCIKIHESTVLENCCIACTCYFCLPSYLVSLGRHV